MCSPYTPLGAVPEKQQVDYTIRATNFVAPGDGNGETDGASVLSSWVCQDRQEERERGNKE
jgi:hypothetical protein